MNTITKTYTSNVPDEIQGTIKIKKMQYGLGPLTDIDGKRWDVKGHFGDWVQAVPQGQLHSYYMDTSSSTDQYFGIGTSGSGIVTQTWKPYKLEVVGDE